MGEVEIPVLYLTQVRWRYMSSTNTGEVEIHILYLAQVSWRYLSST
jgi:hypothetical protein